MNRWTAATEKPIWYPLAAVPLMFLGVWFLVDAIRRGSITEIAAATVFTIAGVMLFTRLGDLSPYLLFFSVGILNLKIGLAEGNYLIIALGSLMILMLPSAIIVRKVLR